MDRKAEELAVWYGSHHLLFFGHHHNTIMGVRGAATQASDETRLSGVQKAYRDRTPAACLDRPKSHGGEPESC